jgi:c-di-GMP-binding flagellar brake protein YcgR
MAFGFHRKEILEGDIAQRIMMKVPFAFTLGEEFKTNEAVLYEISDHGVHIRISIEKPIPILHYFQDVPMSFNLPGDASPWSCQVDIARIYAYDEHENPVYGLEVKFKNLTKEQKLQLQHYLQTQRQNVPKPAVPAQAANPR